MTPELRPQCNAYIQPHPNRCQSVASWVIQLLAHPDETNYACDLHIADFLHFDEINTVRMFDAAVGKEER